MASLSALESTYQQARTNRVRGEQRVHDCLRAERSIEGELLELTGRCWEDAYAEWQEAKTESAFAQRELTQLLALEEAALAAYLRAKNSPLAGCLRAPRERPAAFETRAPAAQPRPLTAEEQRGLREAGRYFDAVLGPIWRDQPGPGDLRRLSTAIAHARC